MKILQAQLIVESVVDVIWQQGHMTKAHVLYWLARRMGLDTVYLNLDAIDMKQCKEAWSLALRFYLIAGELIRCPMCQGEGDTGWPERIWDREPCGRCNGEGILLRGDIRL